jgi:hypothetical protein
MSAMSFGVGSLMSLFLTPILVVEERLPLQVQDVSIWFRYGFILCCVLLIWIQVVIERRNTK